MYTEKGPITAYFQKPGNMLITKNNEAGERDYLCVFFCLFFFFVCYIKIRFKNKNLIQSTDLVPCFCYASFHIRSLKPLSEMENIV